MYEKIDMERIGKFITEFGNFNSLPKPFIILEPNHYYYLLNHFTPYETEFRQIIDHDFGPYAKNTTISWGFDHGLGIMMPAEWKIVGDHCEFKTMPTFFRFGCDHDYQHSTNLGNCYNRYECTKCGFTKDVDSSD